MTPSSNDGGNEARITSRGFPRDVSSDTGHHPRMRISKRLNYYFFRFISWWKQTGEKNKEKKTADNKKKTKQKLRKEEPVEPKMSRTRDKWNNGRPGGLLLAGDRDAIYRPDSKLDLKNNNKNNNN